MSKENKLLLLLLLLLLLQWIVSITTNYPDTDQQQKSESDSLESARSSGYVPITFGKSTKHSGLIRSVVFYFSTTVLHYNETYHLDRINTSLEHFSAIWNTGEYML